MNKMCQILFNAFVYDKHKINLTWPQGKLQKTQQKIADAKPLQSQNEPLQNLTAFYMDSM